ncbi:MAG TPA: tail fiber domain-containing protein [Pyrinomonadaceae bacterium]
MRQKLAESSAIALSTILCLLFTASAALGQTTSFTYQGRLSDGSTPAGGVYDMKFRLYDADGNPQGSPDTVTLDNPGVQVTNGLFTVQLDFGAGAFNGGARLLEISVRPHSADPNTPAYTTLSPRQPITSTPYAVRSITAGAADTATTATSATSATTATTAANFSGSLSGDVTGTQGATVVASVGGQSAASVAGGASAANAATNSNTADAIVRRDSSGNFSAGTITAALSGNAATATTATTASGISASAGDSVITAINASGSAINTSRVSGDVELLPSATQAATQAAGVTRPLVDVKLAGTDNLGTSGHSDLLSLSASGTYKFYTGATPEARDKERFRVDNTGGVFAQGDIDIGSAPAEGSGVRFMWLPYKAAIRGGYVDGTQWDDANIGYFSTAFGHNARASGDYGFAAGQNVVAANSWSTALGHYVTASGAASVGLGYYAHTNSRQGSFVFSDRSVLDDGNFATDESFKASVNHSFNVRATGGYWLFTNTGVSTGLRLSHFLNTNTAYGSFVWTDRSSDSSVTPTAQNQTIFRSSGGYWLYSDSGLSAGVTLAPGGGSWTSISDRNMKANFAAVDTRAILRGVLQLPISTWNYKSQDASVRHIGPMAQDFFAAFKVGEGDKTITTVDPDGVALAAIQGLNEELKDRDARIDGLQQQVRQQQGQIDGLKKLVCLDHPEASVCKEGK